MKKSHGSSTPPAGRKIGYIIAIIIMIVLIYVLRHLRAWGVNILNEDYESALFYIELSIYVSIVANALFIFYDNRWFKHLIHGITNIFSALAIIMIYVIFPFIINNEDWTKWIKIGLIVLFVLSLVGVLAEFIKGFRDLTRNPDKV